MESFTKAIPAKSTKAEGVIMMLSADEAKELMTAMEEYCANNKRKTKAKKLLKEMTEKLEIY